MVSFEQCVPLLVSRMETTKCEAPVFRPSRAAFEHPFEYIASIREQAEPYGICRIVPPSSWKPPFALDLNQLSFPTRVQAIHQLYKRDPVDETEDSWWESYVAFQLAANRKQRTRNPILGGKELELRRLYQSVEKHGGYETVCREKLWKDIANSLQVHLSNGNTTYSLRNVYEKYLKQFEDAQVDIALEQTTKKLKQETKEEPPLRRRRRSARRTPSNLEALMCEHCGGGQFESCIILCDHCPNNKTKGYHTFCCAPPRDRIPDGNFYCPDCSAALFGRECFSKGPEMMYKEFTDYADEFEANDDSEAVTTEEMEKEFWDCVEMGERAMEVLYGADIPTGSHGSGFPLGTAPYADHPMNLNRLPRSNASLLSLTNEAIPGVIVPWLYVGMKFSAFCWHVEDHLFYSINYLHKGAGKKWYGISSNQAEEFEELLRTNVLKDQLREQPDLLFHITTMVAPEKLRRHGIQVCETLQEEGEFVITFPMAYHGGFNTGLNIAEAVNFAPVDWLRFRRQASLRYIQHRKPQVISSEELILKAADRPDGAFRSEALFQEVDRLTHDEMLNRLTLWSQGVVKSMKISSGHGLKAGDTEDVCCVICRDYLHVSAVVCSSCHRPVCMRHVQQQCECPMSSRTLLYRFTLAELIDFRDKSDIGRRSDGKDKRGVKRGSHTAEHQGQGKFQSFLDQWKMQAERILRSNDAGSSEMETLRYEAMQFLWAGHEADFHRQLHGQLTSAIEWYSGLDRLSQSRESKMTVEELKDLIVKTPHNSSHAGVMRLKEMRKEVQDWILKTECVLHPVTDIELCDLMEFHKKGLGMNVQLPGLNLIEERVKDALALQSSIAAVFEPSTRDVHEVRELQGLLQRAKELRIAFPHRARLESFLLGIEEWVETAREKQNERLPMTELRDLLDEVGSVAANVPELLSMRHRLQQADDWILEAQQLLLDAPSISEMERLLEAAARLNVIFPDILLYEQKLEQLKWKQWVQDTLDKDPLTLTSLEECISKGQSCRAEETELYIELQNKKSAASHWKSTSARLLHKIKNSESDDAVTFSDLRSIVEDPSVSIVHLVEVQELKELFQTIQPLAEIIDRTMEAMNDGQSLKSWELAPVVSQAQTIPVEFQHLRELKRRISLAEEFSNGTKRLLTMGLQLSHLNELKEALKNGENFVKDYGFRIAEMDFLLEWDTRLRLEWLMRRLLCDPEEAAEKLLGGLPLDTVPFSPLEILKHRFSEAVQKQGRDPAPNKDDRPQLDAVSAVLEQAKCVNANFQLIGRLERSYAGGLKWTEYVRETIHGCRKLTPLEIQNLLQLGKDSAFKLDGTDQLEEILVAYTRWTEDVEHILSALDKTRLPLEDVQKLLVEIQRSSIVPEGEAAEKLKAVVQPALELRDSLQKELHGAMDALIHTVQKVASVLQYSDWKLSGFNGCYCGQLQGLDPLLTCAKCSHWYHASCIPTVTKSSRRWMCGSCKSSTYRVEKPSSASLQHHLTVYRQLKVFLTEERALEAVLHHFQSWKAQVTDLLDAHEASQTTNRGGPQLDICVLSCIWKQSLVMGVQCPELTDRSLRAVKVAQCRSIIQEHLEDGGPTRFDIPRCRKEEIPLHIIDKKPRAEIVRTFVENSVQLEDPALMDPLVHTAKAALVTVTKWEEECQRLMALLERHSGKPIEHVPRDLLRCTNEHINLATTVRVQVDRDALEQIIFQSTPYCICRQTNDADRPMLACEEEDDCPILWFHHRCVGLSENDTPPPGYRCPHCCLRKGEAYPYALPKGSAMELARQYSTSTSQPLPNGQPSVDAIQLPTSDIVTMFTEVSNRWCQWSDIERLRVLERVAECVREESRRIHEHQQRNVHRSN